MIANCEVLVTKFSTVILNALALGKKVVSDLEEQELSLIAPIQNGGISNKYIANVVRKALGQQPKPIANPVSAFLNTPLPPKSNTKY